LISQLIDNPRGRNIESCFRDIAEAVSSRRNRSIVHVASATALNGDQIARLTKALEKEIGRKVQVNVAVDQSVIGGLSIRFGDELIDGTVASRLGNASRSLASKNA
jgi:F-type H+-transporting ATPase subunit delta